MMSLDDVLALENSKYQAALATERQARAHVEQELAKETELRRAARNTKPCEVCEWPQPIDNDYFICACCGFEPRVDSAEHYNWGGQWWSKPDNERAPKIVRQLEAALLASERAREEAEVNCIQVEQQRDEEHRRLLSAHARETAEIAESAESKAQYALLEHEFQILLDKHDHDDQAGWEWAADANKADAKIAELEARLTAATRTGAQLRDALQGMVGLHDDPTPYDSATTIAVAREALSLP